MAAWSGISLSSSSLPVAVPSLMSAGAPAASYRPAGTYGPHMMDLAAADLGLSRDELLTSLLSGQSLASLAAQRGASNSQLQSDLALRFEQLHPQASSDVANAIISQLMNDTFVTGASSASSPLSLAGSSNGSAPLPSNGISAQEAVPVEETPAVTAPTMPTVEPVNVPHIEHI